MSHENRIDACFAGSMHFLPDHAAGPDSRCQDPPASDSTPLWLQGFRGSRSAETPSLPDRPDGSSQVTLSHAGESRRDRAESRPVARRVMPRWVRAGVCQAAPTTRLRAASLAAAEAQLRCRYRLAPADARMRTGQGCAVMDPLLGASDQRVKRRIPATLSDVS